MNELDQTILDLTDALERFKGRREVFVSDLWGEIVEILDQARLGIMDRFENSDNGQVSPCCVRAQLRMISTLKQLPEQTERVIHDTVQTVDDLEKHKLMIEASEQAFTLGET